jgi:hypothetical protein
MRVALSKQHALWWYGCGRKNLSVGDFFTFPSPVNALESRLHALVNLVLLPISLALDFFFDVPWLFVFIAYGYWARFAAGPRLCPVSFLVLFVLHPTLARCRTRIVRARQSARHGSNSHGCYLCCCVGATSSSSSSSGACCQDYFVPGAPQRFAQLLCACAGSTALVLRFWAPDDTDNRVMCGACVLSIVAVAWGIWLIVWLMEVMVAAFGFCLGGWLYTRCGRVVARLCCCCTSWTSVDMLIPLASSRPALPHSQSEGSPARSPGPLRPL